MTALRSTAVAIAIIGAIDPRLTLPRRARPGVRVIASADAAPVAARLTAAGFTIVASDEAAIVATPGAELPSTGARAPVFLLDRATLEPGVAIQRASASPMRVAGQSVVVLATVHARGARGRQTTIQLEDQGVGVASATHTWSGGDETWEAVLDYLPVRPDAALLRVRASPLPGEHDTGGHAIDVLAPAMRGPVRTLVYNAAIAWPSVFVRRALEAQPGFSVASAQRASRTAATRTGAPPASLTRAGLAPFDVLVSGSLDGLDAAALDAIRWFVEDRGGVFVFVPDRMPGRPIAAVLPGVTFTSKELEAPVGLHGAFDGVTAGEFALPRVSGSAVTTLATDGTGAPVVVAARRGMGAVVVSGALDAWRYRDRGDGAFARSWVAVLLAEAAAVPPRLEVTAQPPAARPGGTVRIRARLRGTELPPAGDRVDVPPARAHAVDPAAHVDVPIRLWPSAEPGVYDGEWRPARDGRYAIEASIGEASAAAVVEVDAGAAIGAPGDATLQAAARVSGGGVFADERALVRALTDRLPPVAASQPVWPARSAWWSAAFAACLCAEWALRRRRGLA